MTLVPCRRASHQALSPLQRRYQTEHLTSELLINLMEKQRRQSERFVGRARARMKARVGPHTWGWAANGYRTNVGMNVGPVYARPASTQILPSRSPQSELKLPTHTPNPHTMAPKQVRSSSPHKCTTGTASSPTSAHRYRCITQPCVWCPCSPPDGWSGHRHRAPRSTARCRAAPCTGRPGPSLPSATSTW